MLLFAHVESDLDILSNEIKLVIATTLPQYKRNLIAHVI